MENKPTVSSQPFSIQASVEGHRLRSEAQMPRMNLLSWGQAVFSEDANSSADPTLWPEKLAEAQVSSEPATDSEDDIDMKIAGFGPDYIASVCVRDHWEQSTRTNELGVWIVFAQQLPVMRILAMFLRSAAAISLMDHDQQLMSSRRCSVKSCHRSGGNG